MGEEFVSTISFEEHKNSLIVTTTFLCGNVFLEFPGCKRLNDCDVSQGFPYWGMGGVLLHQPKI